jgi:macrolide transport system ATP-binding/permease protein
LSTQVFQPETPLSTSIGSPKDSGPEHGTQKVSSSGEIAIPLIELRDIHRIFATDGGVEVHALRGVDLKIYSGEFLAIVGQSGSGKSTLMNLLGCLDRPTKGTYLFAGRDIKSFDEDSLAWLRRDAFGFVFQSYNLLATATAEENVEVPAIYAGLSHNERRVRGEALLTSLGLGDRLDHRPSQLSGGQQQRVSIARAMMNGGKVILADEPTGALDTQSGIEVMALLESLAREGHTVILITHDSEVASHADRMVEFRDGEIISDSGPAEGTVDPEQNKTLRDLFLSRKITSPLAGVGEAIRMALRSLKANIFRTILTLLGIVIGVASVVAMLAIGEGARQDIVDRISSIGTNRLTLQPARIPGQRRSLPSTLTLEDADALTEGLPNILGAMPELQGNYTARFGRQDYSTQVNAVTENMPELNNWPLARGIFFTREDSDKYTPVAVLGSTVAQEIFPGGEDPLGEYILIRNIPFQVIGVLTSKGASSGFGGGDQDDAIFVPFKTGALRLMGQTNARSISIFVDNVDEIEATEQNLIQFMTARHGSEDFRIFNSAELLETVTASQDTFTILLGSVAAISLLVGGIGVMNIMLVSVTERTREIGIRMATGARQTDIMSQFLSEAIVVSGVGGVIGVLIGVAVGYILIAFDVSIKFTSMPMILAFCCATATGLIFGFAPARKAAQLDPVVALANE